MRRKVIAGVAALLAVLVLGVVALSSRDTTKPAPVQAKPSQQFGDDADLMRRLERKKLTTTTSR